MHFAASRSTIGVVQMLLEHGASPKAIDTDGETPLHRASQSHGGNVKIMRMLVDNGAELDTRDKAGRTPLHSAARVRNVEAVKWLIRAGCRLDVTDKDGKTASDMADKDDHMLCEALMGCGTL